MRFDRALIIVAAAAALCGCHIFKQLTPDCHVPQEYQRAVQLPPLKVPEGMDTPNTQSALVIPNVEVTPPPPGPHDACLDVPPHYVPAPANKSLSGAS
jgi:uncharacterized lipoprotein